MTLLFLYFPTERNRDDEYPLKRWKHVWEYIPTLNFDSSDVLYDMAQEDDETAKLEIETPRYIHWVDQVLSSHKAPTLDDFRVQFDIRSDHDGKTKTTIDNWIRFAMERRVKRLTIDLSGYNNISQRELAYTFPSLSSLYSNRLTYLKLSGVNIAGDVLESFLCNCLVLEYLSVSFSRTLERLRVAGRSLNLKYLKLHGCYHVRQLEIYAPNLVSFYYFGSKLRVQYQSLSKVVEISFGREYGKDLRSVFSDLGCHVSQIEVLNIQLNTAFQYLTLPIEYPVFKRLKKLDVHVHPGTKDDLFYLSSPINVCPFLHHFRLQISPVTKKKRRMRKWEREPCAHYNMKILEIIGFDGRARSRFRDCSISNIQWCFLGYSHS